MRKIVARTFAILMLLLAFSSLGLKAQITNGGVYNFVNVEKKQSMCAPSLDVVASQVTNTQDYSQLWYAEGNSGQFTLRNLGNGRYLKSTSSQSGRWTLVPTKENDCYLSCEGTANHYVVKNTDGSQCMHFDMGQNCVVSWWESNVTKSQWNITPVTISPADLDANWKELEELSNATANVAQYQEHLNALFSDQACTQLKVANVENNSDYLALPATLQKMVLKVQSGNWAEENANTAKAAWGSDYAQKYRVQLYEPYSDPVESGKALKINHHSNLNNPTGLYANSRQTIYVMVEGEIKPGAELYIGSYMGHGKPEGSFRNGQQLHEGLNAVTYWADGNATFINYVVETFKDGKMTDHKLSQYAPLKIHIEGGHINGYFNAVGDALYPADKDADWDYCEARANLEDITILGKYQTLQFYLHPQPQGNDPKAVSPGVTEFFTEKASVEKVIAEWDRIVYSERLTLGMLSKEEVDAANKLYPTLDNPSRGIYTFIGGEENGFYKDYSDSYRLHGLSYGIDHAYMYASNEYSGYNINTFGSIVGKIADEAGPVWGPAHEIGHQHQATLNMHGLTEVSNNIFSNVAVWYNGKATSRVNGQEGCLQSVLAAYNQENADFFTNNIWAQTQMYYKLWMYYHLTGHNNKFYPRLFELLRNDPMVIPGGSRENPAQQDGAKCLLHFYKMCCKAAQEDLTEFFKAYGFFSVMQDRFVEDYTPAIYNQTQQQIDAAIAEVKAMGYPVNYTAILINDGTNDQTFGHDGKTVRSLWDEAVSAEKGNYIGFYPGKENKMTQAYHCNVEGNVVTLSGGQGGVGFLIYDKNGELLSFSDCSEFKISTRAQAAFAMGEAQVYVANGDNTLEEIQIENALGVQREMLQTLVNGADEVLNMVDNSHTKVGFFYPETVVELQKAKDEANKVLSGHEESKYAGTYKKLYDEYTKLMADEFARVEVVPNNAYVLTNRLYPEVHLSIITDNKNLQGTQGAINDAEKWIFEAVGGDTYMVKNKQTQTYLKDLEKDKVHVADAVKGEVSYKLVHIDNGYFALTCQNKDGQSLNYNPQLGDIVLGWNSNDQASQWRLEAVEVSELDQAKVDLAALIGRTNMLMDECGRVTVGSPFDLQVTHASAPGYLSSNADQNTGGGDQDGDGVAALLDNDVTTYFHSRWGGDGVAEPHYLQVDLGAGMMAGDFKLFYVIRKAVSTDKNSPAPTKVTIQGSVDGKVFTDIVKLTKEDNGLPAYTDMGKKWTSDVLKGGSYRYIRFVVTESQGPANNQFANQYFFGLSEFGMENVGVEVKVNPSMYEVTEELMLAAFHALADARAALDHAQTVAEFETAQVALQQTYEALAAARDASLKYFQLAVSEYEYAGLYLDKNATLPNGVTAYVVSQVNPASVTLTPIQGKVVPAHTGVIVKAAQGVYRLDYTLVPAEEKSLLKGAVSTVFLKGEPNMSYYLFGVKAGKVGLYKAYLEYLSDGTQGEGNVLDDTDNGGYFKVSANKVYLPEVSTLNALSFVFDEATGIEDVEAGAEAAVIYDLQGRRVHAVQKSGLYIVNGEKVFLQK